MACTIQCEQRIPYAKELAVKILRDGMSIREVCEDMDISQYQYQNLVRLFDESVQKRIYDQAKKNGRNKR